MKYLIPTAFAQQLYDVNSVARKATDLGNLAIQLAIYLAVIWIIVSVVRYLIAGGEDGRKKMGESILWGIVGLFVILSIWGFVYILRRTFQTRDNIPTQDIRNIQIPYPPGVGGRN